MANAAITVDLNAKIASFEYELKRATESLDNFGKKGDQIAAGFKTAFGALGAAVSVGAFAGFIKSSIDAQDAISKLSQKTGIAVEALAGLQHAADLSDVGVDQLAKGIRTFSVAVSESARGMKTYQDKLTALGLDYKKLKDLSPEDQFYALADAVQKLGKEDRAVAVTSALGDKMSVLVPLLSGGADGLRQMVAEGQKYNPVTAESAQLAEEFNDNLTRLQASASAAGVSIASDLLPSLSATAQRVRELMDEDKGIQALIRAFAGLGKLPWDMLFGDIKGASNANDRIKELRDELVGLQSDLKKAESGGSRSSVVMRAMFGSPEEISQKITVTKNQIEALEKFGEKIYKGREKTAGEAGAKEGIAYAGGVSKGLKSAKVKLDEIDPFGKQRSAALKAYQDQIDETDKLVREHLLKTMQEVRYESVTAWEEAGQALTYSMRTPAEKLTEQLEYIQQLLDKGVITPETFSRATAAARESFDSIGREAESMSDSISDSLTDALMRGFEGGKDFAENFKDTLKNLFNTLILKPLIQPIAQGGASAVTGMIGMGSSGSAMASGGSFLSAGSSFMSAMAPGAISAEIGMYAGGIAETLGASSSFAGSIGAGIATAIPWIGGALAIGAALGLFGGKPSNKAAGGTYDFGTDSSTTWNMSGDKQASQETMDARSATLNSISGFDALITKLGGSIAAQSIGVDIGERDGVQFAIDGGPLQSYGSDANAALAQLFRELVAGSDGLSESFQTLLGQFEGTAEEMLYLGDALVTLQDYMDSDLIAVALDQIEQAGRSTWQTWQAGNTELRTMAANFDGSLASATALADATRAQYQLELNLIGQIQGLLISTNAMFGNSIEQIMLSNMDAAQQYDYWRAEVDKDYADLLNATDPAEIARLSGEINQGSLNAYGLLEDDQKAALAPEFIAYLEGADTLTTERLNASQDAIVATHADLTTAIETVMTQVADKMMDAAELNFAASQTSLAAARTPVTIGSITYDNPMYEVGG